MPMILHGDEMGRTQQGNNNTYCQDNELSWMDWNLDRTQQEMLRFTREMIALRREHAIFRRRRFLQGVVREDVDSNLPDVEWLRTDGAPMTDSDWNEPQNKCLTVFLNGSAIPEPNERGEAIVDDSALILFNASGNDVIFTLPGEDHGKVWTVEVGTGGTLEVGAEIAAGESITRPSHSFLVLLRPPASTDPEEIAVEDLEKPELA